MSHLEIQLRKDAQDQAATEFVDAWKNAEAGATASVSDRLYFSDWATFTAIFTPRRIELVEELRREPAAGIRDLAKRLGRDKKNVHADVQALVTVGLIERSGARLLAPYAEVGVSLRLAPR